jgi:hypothetical protein
MGLLDAVLRPFQPLRIDDPVLGPLRFQKVGFWEGRRTFAPAGGDVEFTVDADKAGPSDGQREFFIEFVRRYPELWAKVEPMLRSELSKWSDDCKAVFAIESFGVPGLGSEPPSWEVVYTTESAERYFCVLFDGWQPTGIRVDG